MAAAELFLRAEVVAGVQVCCGAQEGAVEMLHMIGEVEIVI